MRRDLAPDWETAEKLYPIISSHIEKYTEYCDENGDEDFTEYKKLEQCLHEITGKDMSQYNLWQWWEEEGLEVLSFRISLPAPQLVQDITKEELAEVITLLKSDSTIINQNDAESFKNTFSIYLGEYYHDLLKLNFKKYKREYFMSNKGKNGKYFEYSVQEATEKIW